MDKLYNYTTGKFYGSYRDIVTFDLDIRLPITQVYGNSGTGKSFLVDFIKNEKLNKKYNSYNMDLSNIKVFDSNNSDSLTIENLSNLKNCLIIIDRCDLILDLTIVDFIANDRNNHYLLFSREAYSLGLSPNYYGEFCKSNKTITIKYPFSEKGWF